MFILRINVNELILPKSSQMFVNPLQIENLTEIQLMQIFYLKSHCHLFCRDYNNVWEYILIFKRSRHLCWFSYIKDKLQTNNYILTHLKMLEI